MKAIWNNTVIAESNETITIEGNQYFPPQSIHADYFTPSETHTVCHWKGTASYYNIEIDGQINKDAAWYYPETSSSAAAIKGYVAFWKGVQVIKD
jgi:uncharacterized protein (DUF427 family)